MSSDDILSVDATIKRLRSVAVCSLSVLLQWPSFCIVSAPTEPAKVSWAALASKGTTAGANVTPVPPKPQATVKPEPKPDTTPSSAPLPQRSVLRIPLAPLQ